VKLQVKDNDGAISTDSYIIIIKQLEPPLQLPVAQANGPYMSFTNESIAFNSTGSYDPDGTIVNYTWDFGDKNTSHMENPIHSYAKQGNYIVFLTVVDNDNLSNTAIASIYIRDPEPEEEKEQPLPILLILFMAITTTIMSVFILKSKRRRRQIYYYMKNKLNNVHNMELKANELLSRLNNRNNKEIKKEKLRNHRNPREKLEQSLRKRRQQKNKGKAKKQTKK
jgi:PKD repeat protein